MAYGQRDGSNALSNGMSIFPGQGMHIAGQQDSAATVAQTGSFSDEACSHHQWHQEQALPAFQPAELTPELAGSKFMLDGMMACSMPVIV